mgnify:CR=1 FL=1
MASETARLQAYAYVGIDPCGCIRAATVDGPAWGRDVRRDINAFLRYGGTVERMEIERVRVQFCVTKHGPKGKCPHPGSCPERLKEPKAKEAPTP